MTRRLSNDDDSAVVFCKEEISIFFTLFSQGQMNEALRIEISKELGFSNRINLDGTEYYK